MWGIQTHGYTSAGTAHRRTHTFCLTPRGEGAVVRLYGVSPRSCSYPALQQRSAKWALAYAVKPHLIPHAQQRKYPALIVLPLVNLNHAFNTWMTCTNKPFVWMFSHVFACGSSECLSNCLPKENLKSLYTHFHVGRKPVNLGFSVKQHIFM